MHKRVETMPIGLLLLIYAISQVETMPIGSNFLISATMHIVTMPIGICISAFIMTLGKPLGLMINQHIDIMFIRLLTFERY